MGDIFKDKRFIHVGSDPLFKNISKSDKKIKIDKRFQSVFTDKKFQLKYAVDIRGRPVRESLADNYKKYYDISSASDSEENEISEDQSEEDSKLSDIDSKFHLEREEKEAEEKTELKSGVESNLKSVKENNNVIKKIRKQVDEVHKTKTSDAVHGRLQDMSIDYARGVGSIMSDSSSDDSSSDESDSLFVEHPWAELDKDAETTEEATSRIAICYLDWDRIYAKDLMVLLHSFLPADGIIESVSVYPSEFGLERMKEEELNGPKELLQVKENEDLEEEECENEDAEGKAYHMEKLREYQLNRLKYYYAVVVCNNLETANKLYTECNGMEYESCAAKIDMRFIPDDMTFDQEPREVCTDLPDTTKYKPRLFENSALRLGKVSLTWDETDPRRIEFNKKMVKGNDINDEDIQNYVAASSEESGEEGIDLNVNSSDDDDSKPKDKLSKYRSIIAALKSGEEKKKNRDVEMEISWGVGIKDRNDDDDDDDGDDDSEKEHSKRMMASDNKMQSSKDAICDDSSDDNSSSDWDNSHSLKKKRKRKKLKDTQIAESDEERKLAELELLLSEDAPEENKKHFSLKGIQNQEKEGKAKKKKWRKELKKKINSKKEEDNFKVDVSDSRFSALYSSHHFNIDPAHPQYKRTKAMEELVAEKQKRRKFQDSGNSSENMLRRNLNSELSSLVSSVKEKSSYKMKIS